MARSITTVASSTILPIVGLLRAVLE